MQTRGICISSEALASRFSSEALAHLASLHSPPHTHACSWLRSSMWPWRISSALVPLEPAQEQLRSSARVLWWSVQSARAPFATWTSHRPSIAGVSIKVNISCSIFLDRTGPSTWNWHTRPLHAPERAGRTAPVCASRIKRRSLPGGGVHVRPPCPPPLEKSEHA